jgi:hypothetical protein
VDTSVCVCVRYWIVKCSHALYQRVQSIRSSTQNPCIFTLIHVTICYSNIRIHLRKNTKFSLTNKLNCNIWIHLRKENQNLWPNDWPSKCLHPFGNKNNKIQDKINLRSLSTCSWAHYHHYRYSYNIVINIFIIFIIRVGYLTTLSVAVISEGWIGEVVEGRARGVKWDTLPALAGFLPEVRNLPNTKQECYPTRRKFV